MPSHALVKRHIDSQDEKLIPRALRQEGNAAKAGSIGYALHA
jgi:hypothetical protein